MKDAIKRAIEGGFRKEEMKAGYPDEYNIMSDALDHKASTLLLPHFWQSLGKAEGWRYPESRDDNLHFNGEWMRHWQDFLHHLAEGKTPDSFFEKLLANK